MKRVFDSMAMPPNGEHFELLDLLLFLDFLVSECLEIVCAEAVPAND